MNASLAWLRQFVPIEGDAATVRDLLTAHAATVEDVLPLRADLAQVVVARVVEAKRHPDSDHLWLTQVDDGSGELLSVVCGAPNVTVGARYPFAPVGTVLPGGLKLERRKIRGQYSNGMLCSARELLLGDDHEGILELETDAAPGTAFLDAYPASDTRLVIDVLPNRPDLLSHRGLARELAAASGLPLRDPPELAPVFGGEFTQLQSDSRIASVDGVEVRLEDAEGCPLYVAAVIRGLTVGPSPGWLRARVESVGGRSINNVVDVTNYMLHGYGQPMHAFDLSRLAGPAIVIRRARAGERLLTLDGADRALDPEMTVIADAERSHAIAGVMGGRDSEVGERTQDIVLEVALFEPRRVRNTRRRTGLSTDASYRFERGLDAGLPEQSVLIAARLLMHVAGGVMSAPPVVVGRRPAAPRTVSLRPSRAARLIGVPLGAEDCQRLLASVGFRASGSGDSLCVEVPGWRSDVVREVDLIEEVARLHGYDCLPEDIRPFRPGNSPDHPLVAVIRRLQSMLAGAGLFEARPLPFVAGDDASHVRVQNPLAENEAHLRTSIVETLARRAEHNLGRMAGDIRLFEVGTVFSRGEGDRPVEELRVAAVVMGGRRPRHFTEPRPPAFDRWDAKALAELAASEANPGAKVALEPVTDTTSGLLWRVIVNGAEVGTVQRMELDAPVWAEEAFSFELSLGNVEALGAEPSVQVRSSSRYETLPTTPAAEFDLALLVPVSIAAASVRDVLTRTGGDLLERVELFDEFTGAGVAEGMRSLAWRLTFRHPERTLRDREIDGRRAKLLQALEEELNVRVRG